jgi:phage head-tail adaptor, putative, SPP1 family
MAITDAKLAKLGLKFKKKAMRDDCEILSKDTTPNASGGYEITDWVVVATVKSLVTPASGGTRVPPQKLLGQQVVVEADAIIDLPYGTVVKENQRLRIKGVIYRVVKQLKGSFDIACKVAATYSTLD